MSASPSPSASIKACTIHRGDTRRCLDADSLLDGRRRRCGRPPALPSRVNLTPAPVRLIVRRVKPTPGPSWPSSPPTVSRLHHRPGREMLEAGGRPSPPRRDRECHPRPQARCGVEPSPLGPLRRQRRWLAVQVMAHNIARWSSAHRSGRAGGDHQDPPAAVLLPGRTDHPLGAPPHTASATALALGSQVRSCPARLRALPLPA